MSSRRRVGLSQEMVTVVAECIFRWAHLREVNREGPGFISTSPARRRRKHSRKLVDLGGR